MLFVFDCDISWQNVNHSGLPPNQNHEKQQKA